MTPKTATRSRQRKGNKKQADLMLPKASDNNDNDDEDDNNNESNNDNIIYIALYTKVLKRFTME